MQREILFKGLTKSSKEWIIGDLNNISGSVFIFPRTPDTPFHSPDWFEIIPESVCQMFKYDGKTYWEGDYNENGEMLVFCDSCMGLQFAQVDIPTKDVVIKCHNCDGNFMFHDAINNFKPIGNIHDLK